MNLIELQDKLRSMPAQMLQQYANGMNPEVPPWLALSVLQQKQMDAQRMGVAQGAAMGQMPTVKDKVEQSSGLMALQQQKQQQAAAQAAEQNAQKPSPVPGGVPPAERQPEAGMRSGGIVGLPTGLKLAGGGIVAFQGGGASMQDVPPEVMTLLQEMKRVDPNLNVDYMANAYARSTPEKQQAMLAQLQDQAKYARRMPRYETPPGIEQRKAMLRGEGVSPEQAAATKAAQERPLTDILKDLGSKAKDTFTDIFGTEEENVAKRDPISPAATRMTPDEARKRASAAVMDRETIPAAPTPAAPKAPPAPPVEEKPAGLPAAMPARERPDTTLPAIAPAAPAAPEKTPAQLAMEMQQGVGYGSNYGKDREALSKQMAARYGQYQQGRGLDDLIRVLSGAGRGYGGQAAAYLENRQRGLSEDTAEQQRQMNLLKELESGRQEQGKALFQGAAELGKQQMAGAQGMEREKLSQAAQNARAQLQANISMYGADRVYDAAMAQVEAANKRADVQERRAVIDGIKAQMNALTTELKGLPAFGKDSKARREELQRQIDELRRALKDSGEGGPAAPTGGTPTQVIKFDANGNPIK